MRNILLLTATITPPSGVPLLARTDPALRLDDYKAALRFYIGHLGTTFDGIVFAENSATDLAELRALAVESGFADRIEFISFFGLDHPASFGRGYGEFKLVDFAMAGAEMLEGDVVVWKCTGRYIVRNIAQVVRRRPPVDLYVHMRNIPQRLCDLYLMAFTRAGHDFAIRDVYKQLRNDVEPGVHANEESAFRLSVDRLGKGIRIRRRFDPFPIIEGVRGWNNAPYAGEWTMKALVRRACQVFLPWVWI